MRIFSTSHTFDYDWDEVSTANWRKYCPWNRTSSHVVSVDTLSRRLNVETGILVTERLITCKQTAPSFVQTLLGGQCTTYSYEKSLVDPKNKQVTMCSHNLTWSNLLSVRETVLYKPADSLDQDQSSRTVFEQEAQITALCGGWKKMRGKIEDVTLDRFRENATKGREGFENVLEMSRKVFENHGEISSQMEYTTK